MDLIPQFQAFISSTLTALGLMVLVIGIGFQVLRFFDEQAQMDDGE